MPSIDSREKRPCHNEGKMLHHSIAIHSISHFGIAHAEYHKPQYCPAQYWSVYIGPVLAPCLSSVEGNCIANHFYGWLTNAVGDWKRPSLIRWISEEASFKRGLCLFSGECLLPGMPPLRGTSPQWCWLSRYISAKEHSLSLSVFMRKSLHRKIGLLNHF